MLKKYEYTTITGEVNLQQMGDNGWQLIHIGRNLKLQKEYIFMREKRIDLCARGF